MPSMPDTQDGDHALYTQTMEKFYQLDTLGRLNDRLNRGRGVAMDTAVQTSVGRLYASALALSPNVAFLCGRAW